MPNVNTPRLSGKSLRAATALLRQPLLGRLIADQLKGQLGITALRSLPESDKGSLPFQARPLLARASHERSSENLDPPGPQDWPCMSSRYMLAYEAGLSPLEATERALTAARDLAEQTPESNPMMDLDESGALRDAEAATARWKAGKTLGPLDGVPVAIKEELGVAGLPARMGTGWMPATPVAQDATATKRLRDAGAVILGTTVMTEYGLSPLGGNIHRAMPRNAHDKSRLPGGSSSGSGVAVARGLCPIALGTDAGGSVRIPAAWNGVFGLKPTFSRIPITGDALPGGCSMNHVGPIGASTLDLALAIEATAGPCPGDDFSAFQSPLARNELTSAMGRGVRSLKIGIVEDEWSAAAAPVSRICEEAVQLLAVEGAEIVKVQIPLASRAPAIGLVTVGIEMKTVLDAVVEEHMAELGPDVQLLMRSIASFRPDDYLDAQRIRSRIKEQVAAALREVDVLILPTTAGIPPTISDQEAQNGFVDPDALDQATRFAFLANACGLPAGTAPVGSADGLPVGLQVIGDAWDEACVIQVLAHLERAGVACIDAPEHAVHLLEV